MASISPQSCTLHSPTTVALVADKDELFYQQTWGVRDIPILARDKYRFWTGHRRWHTRSAEFWYEDAGSEYYVHIFNRAGALSHEILAGKRDLPRYGAHLRIEGDKIEVVEQPPHRPDHGTRPDEENDFEDCSQELASLPVIDVQESLHFTKHPSYKEEIRNLLKFRGSSRIVQLLGRSADNKLVFPKYASDLFVAAMLLPIAGRRATIKRWMLELIDAVMELHSVGLVHRDLVLRNVLLADPVVLCDLQCRYSSCLCPEIKDWDTAQYSPASDVYALGYCLREMCYANTPETRFPDYPVPHPFDKVFEACVKDKAENRPTMEQLKQMVENVIVD